MRATITDIAGGGKIIDSAADAVGDTVRVNGISFGIKDDKTLVEAAREAAWNDARAKAEQLAGLAGRKRGPVMSVSETVGRPPAPMQLARLQAADSSTPLQPGSAVSVSLEVDFSFQG
ncbi:MAG TPA: SIMPL domain-containing protein [Acidimicrobiia bacterium]|nr:SIMPL domain-containing protein [Acidimicrobiia bacterium]